MTESGAGGFARRPPESGDCSRYNLGVGSSVFGLEVGTKSGQGGRASTSGAWRLQAL